MSSDVVRRFEIQLDAHKRLLREKGERINELEARNIDLEARVSHLQEVIDKQQTHSNGEPGPVVNVNDGEASDVVEREREFMQSDRQLSSSNNLQPTPKKRSGSDSDLVPDGPSPESGHGGLEPKRRKLSSDDVAQPRSSPPPGHHTADKPRPTHSATGHVNALNGVKDDHAVGQGDQSPIFSPPRTYDLVHPHPVEDSESESESSEYEDEVIHVEASSNASPESILDKRIARVKPFNHGIVAEEYLEATCDRQTLGKRLDCSGSGTVACSSDGTDYLFTSLKQHPYAPDEQGMPGLYFSAALDQTLSSTYEVLVGVAPGKYKYMGEYRLERMDVLTPGEFKSLPRGTKTFWANNILKQKKYGLIWRRILQRRTYVRDLDAQDITRAYEKGEEKMYVWRMTCIVYNDDVLSQATNLPLEEGHCCGI